MSFPPDASGLSGIFRAVGYRFPLKACGNDNRPIFKNSHIMIFGLTSEFARFDYAQRAVYGDTPYPKRKGRTLNVKGVP